MINFNEFIKNNGDMQLAESIDISNLFDSFNIDSSNGRATITATTKQKSNISIELYSTSLTTPRAVRLIQLISGI